VKRKLSGILFFDLLLIIFAFFYYLIFFNRGIIDMDEGYMLHLADRITQGQMPFRDFVSIYTPGYLYIIAIVFKLFGSSIVISRLVSLFFCLGIILVTFLLLLELKIKAKFIHLASFLCLISFGYPLINIVTVSWPAVLFVLFLILLLIKNTGKTKKYLLVLIGLDLALILFFKQNFGLYFALVTLALIFWLDKGIQEKIKSVLIISVSFLLPSLFWVYFLLIKNPQGFSDFLSYSRTFASTFVFTYPPLSFLLQPFGIFKLIPYYLPLIFVIVIVYFISKGKIDKKYYSFYLFPLLGFIALIYPGSDLLHLYPFYGFILVSILVFSLKNKYFRFVLLVIILNILIGFYLTLFREYFRYLPPYRYQNTAINVPRAKGLLVSKERALAIQGAYYIIAKNTAKNDRIFVYPASPMLYFLFERQNPSKDSFYVHPYSTYTDDRVIKEIRGSNIKYIVTDGEIKFPSELSKLVQKQHLIYQSDQIRVFKAEKF